MIIVFFYKVKDLKYMKIWYVNLEICLNFLKYIYDIDVKIGDKVED